MGHLRSAELLQPGNGRATEEIDRDAVRAQLERILASNVFRNSKRYSSLLRYVVEQTLDGRADHLKERTIGIDVFSRASDYDTNADHVVRSVAGDVRRRLAQYYMEIGHEAEMRIDLQVGSYVPQFRFPGERLSPGAVAEPAEVPALVPLDGPRPSRRVHLWLIAAVAALVVAGVILWVQLAGPRTALDRFWRPVFSSPATVQICVGGGGANPVPAPDQTTSVSDFERSPSRHMHTSDARALAGLAGLLQAHGKAYRILNRAAATSFRDLQSGPFVLIGAMNNEWTLRLTSGQRFSFEKTPNGARIVDRQNPTNTEWSLDFSAPLSQLTHDYAIVSRVRDPKSEQTAVILGGIGSWGTLAAGEFVGNPENLDKLDAVAPKHWERKNVQVVISTDIIGGSSGPPKVLAVHFW